MLALLGLLWLGLRVAYAHTNQYLEHVWAPGTTPDGYTLLCGLDRLARRHTPILKTIWAHLDFFALALHYV